MRVRAYIHSMKDTEHDRNVLGEAEIIRCTAIFNFFTGRYYVDDLYGVVKEDTYA